jgi:hypothetical protein
MTKRIEDVNGWFEVKNNPLSKVGVFPYLGASIDPSGEFGIDPEKVYSVYRPEKELSSRETLDSFKLIPWIDEHEMLGDYDYTTRPEDKGVDGVVGEDVFFDDGFIKGNIKLFSSDLKEKIESGKVELSCGYRCDYEKAVGTYGDQEYDFIQTNIRGNHLASVDTGRMGPEVSVLDQNLTFTIDSKDIIKMSEKETDEMKDSSHKMEIKDSIEELSKKLTELYEMVSPMLEKEKEEIEVEDEDKESDACDEEKEEDEKVDNTELKTSMDRLESELAEYKRDGKKMILKEINKCNDLYDRASNFTGSFDHSDMTSSQIAAYACEKIGIKVDKGHEVSALEGFLHNRDAGKAAFSLDSSDSVAKSDSLKKYFGE